MAKWQVYYEIGKLCDLQEFDDEEGAQHFFDMICETAQVYEEETGEDTTIVKEQIDG